jgi:DnaJ like chaperone protein
MKPYLGRIVGALIGMFIAPPFGLFIGFIFGSFIDQGRMRNAYAQSHRSGRFSLEHLFLESTFIMLGYIAKADGIISTQEIQKTNDIMQQFRLNPQQKEEAQRLFYRGKQQHFELEPLLATLAATQNAMYLNTFMTHLIDMAYTGGSATVAQKNLLQSLCRRLGLRPLNFVDLDRRYRHPGHQQHKSYNYTRPSQNTLINPYETLGISIKASDQEVRHAYRKLVSRYHPDKVIAQGLPETELKHATDMTQKIRGAYENILEERGIPA